MERNLAAQLVDGSGDGLDYNALVEIITQRQVASGVKSTDRTARIGDETASEANARITAAYKAQAQPDLTVEGKAAGATIEFVRTGAGGVGEYREVFPVGAPIPTTRTTTSGNVYDQQGNLVSGTGLKTATSSASGTKTVQSSVKNPDGSTTITYTDGTKTTTSPTVVTPQDPLGGNLDNPAFSIVAGILKNYDMKGVADAIAKIRKDYPEIASDDILALLKFDTRYNASYLERFAGNAELIRKGLPTLNDEAYLKVEKEYEKIFKAYDVGSLASRQMYAKLIGNSMDAVDVTGRLKVGYDRLKADKNIEAAFRRFYPSLGDGDIVAAMLNPEEMLPALQRKAAAAEIGGSYLAQSLETTRESAESLAAFGIDKAGAQAGVRYIAQALPRGRFLSQISQETGINYTQQTAEDITFRKNVKAQQEEELLKAKEVGRFSGESGLIGSKALASQQRGSGAI
jgi:hypothetical protein